MLGVFSAQQQDQHIIAQQKLLLLNTTLWAPLAQQQHQLHHQLQHPPPLTNPAPLTHPPPVSTLIHFTSVIHQNEPVNGLLKTQVKDATDRLMIPTKLKQTALLLAVLVRRGFSHAVTQQHFILVVKHTEIADGREEAQPNGATSTSTKTLKFKQTAQSLAIPALDNIVLP